MGRSEATIEWVLHNSKEIFDNGPSKTFPKMFWKTATPRLFLVKFQNDSRQLIINGKKKKKKKKTKDPPRKNFLYIRKWKCLAPIQ